MEPPTYPFEETSFTDGPLLLFLAAAGSEEEVPAWGAWSSCQRDGFRTRLQVCDEAPCPSEKEECIFYGNESGLRQG